MNSSSIGLLALLFLLGCDVAQPIVGDAGPEPEVDGGSSDCPPMGAACALSGDVVLEVPSLFGFSLAGISPAPGVDYAALAIDGSPREGFGTACSGATDAAACAAALDIALDRRAPGFANACGLPSMCGARLIVTRGDEVLAIDDVAGMPAVLGTIDTPEEAALIGFATPGGAHALPYATRTVHRVAAAEQGYDLSTTYLEADCDPILSRGATLHVSPEGATTDLCDTLTSCDPGRCI